MRLARISTLCRHGPARVCCGHSMRARFPGCLLTLGLRYRNPPSGEETDLRTHNAFALLGQGVGDESDPTSASGSQWTEVGAGRRARAQPSQGTRASATASRASSSRPGDQGRQPRPTTPAAPTAQAGRRAEAGSAAPSTTRAPAQPSRAPPVAHPQRRSKATTAREERRARSQGPPTPRRSLRFAEVVTVRDIRSRSQAAPAERGVLSSDFPPLAAAQEPLEVSAPRSVPIGTPIAPAPQNAWAPQAPAAPAQPSAGSGPSSAVLLALEELFRQVSMSRGGQEQPSRGE